MTPPTCDLTIGIPTFNRSHMIGKAIASVRNQLTDISAGRIELLVSDNASTDDTQTVIAALQAHAALPISYYRNETNVGMDRNFDLLFKRGRGRFVWMLGDDDYLLDDAIAFVLQLIDRNPDVKVFQTQPVADRFVMAEWMTSTVVKDDRVCHSGDEFFQAARGGFGNISSLIVHRDSWNMADLEGGFGTQFMHFYGIARVLAGAGKSYIIKRPLVVCCSGYPKSYFSSGDVLINTILGAARVVAHMRQMGYHESTCKQLLEGGGYFFFVIIPYAKALGIRNTSQICRDLKAHYNTPAVRLFCVPVICWPSWLYPGPLLRWLYAVYLKQKTRGTKAT